MKTFLALLISCLTLSAATTYPVLTDSTNRLFPGGVTNVFLLNSNIVTTGTMRATGAVTLTNSGNVFAGNGAGLTNLSVSGGILTSNGLGTNLVLKSTLGTTNWGLRVYGSNHTSSIYIDEDVVIRTGKAYPAYILKDANGANLTTQSGRFIIENGLAVNSGDLITAGGGIGSVNSTYTLGIGNYSRIGFSSGAAFNGTPDVALFRNSAGVLEINNGTAGTYRDMAARSLYTTNLYATNLVINGGATVTKILSATATLNFDLTALTVEDLTITVTGAADGDVVTIGVPNGSVTASVQYSAWVSAADTVTVRARTSAAGENPASGTFRATIFRH